MRKTITQWFDSLVNRAVLLVVVVTVLTAVIVTVVSVQVSRQELEAQTRAQVTTIASMVALDVDQKLAERFLVLSNVAESLTMEEITFELRAQLLDVELTMLRLGRDMLNERLVFVLRDDRERRQHEEKLSWEATHDTLTGLLNRRGFNDTLTKWLLEANSLTRPSVMMLIDLNYFKPVNDRGGHLLGDDLLRRLARCFTDAVRQSDFAARLGGDEFAIILPACGIERAKKLAEDIRVSVGGLRIEKDDVSYGVTASIGLTELSAQDSGPRETVARADKGCYAAKARGRNLVVTVPAPPVTAVQ